ncbi:hypothetical protein KJ742_05500 [Patescibacteria group bacterium]|nr:hypothetical protein [Patescibacteria group bacterium]MBU1683372.1 hypothetical protein [Patescibacteria group bacterium]MBU1934432.1 hypothetical protein [Patescibacteria group bacterium]
MADKIDKSNNGGQSEKPAAEVVESPQQISVRCRDAIMLMLAYYEDRLPEGVALQFEHHVFGDDDSDGGCKRCQKFMEERFPSPPAPSIMKDGEYDLDALRASAERGVPEAKSLLARALREQGEEQ